MKYKYMWRKLIHPVLLKGFVLASGCKLLIEKYKVPKGNCIFAATHTNAHDVPLVMQAVKKHCWLMASDEVKGKIGGLGFELNGVVYVHRESRESRNYSIQRAINIISDAESLVMFPEGTWNTTPSSPILNLRWGIVDIASKTGAPIIPIATEYIDETCHVCFGNPIRVDSVETTEQKKAAIEHLEESLATMKWNLWGKYGGTYQRSTGNLNEKRLEKYKKEYPAIDYDYEKQFHFRKATYLEELM